MLYINIKLKTKNYKLLKENTGGKLSNIRVCKNFLYNMQMKAWVNWLLSKLKKFALHKRLHLLGKKS